MKKTKILLIDDNQSETDHIKTGLNKAGYLSSNIRQIGAGQAALDLLEQETFDVILLDISMPQHSDVEAFHALNQKSAETPIIVLSGADNFELTDTLLTCGAQDFLMKEELNAQVLSHAVRFALERQALTEKLAQKEQEVEVLKESMEGIVQQSIGAVLVIDSQNRICFVNAAAADIFGRLPEEMRGRRFTYGVCAGQTLETELLSAGGISRAVVMRGVAMMWKKRRAMLVTVYEKQSRAGDDKNYLDPLTGAYNKAYLEERASLFDCPDNLPLCVIVGDVNNLQLINDSLGHEAGDELLRRVARCFKNACINESIVIRYGGDEFLIILSRCDEQDAERIMEKIRCHCTVCSMEGFPVSIALGSAVKYSGDTLSFSDLQWIADEHMYAKKYTVVNPSKYSAVISALEKSLYAKDYATAMHTSRVRDLCVSFGKYLHMDPSVIDELILLSALHDIGKIALPSSILCKPGPLSKDEWETIKTHPEIGAKIVKVTHGMDLIALSILNHHERWDGSGYPNGQKSELIPLSARILSIVDSFDVMTHERPYKRAISEEEALEEINHCGGTQFDPRLAGAFITFIRDRQGRV